MNWLVVVLARLVRPIVEEATRQTHARRSDEAYREGRDGLGRYAYMLTGPGPLGTLFDRPRDELDGVPDHLSGREAA